MKNLQLTLFLFFLIFLTSCQKNENTPLPMKDPSVETAKYKITFKALWSKDTHPVDFPSNSHFSRMIGMSHNEKEMLFDTEKLATDGIKLMAETGGTSILSSEINAKVQVGNVGNLILGNGLGTSPSETSFEVEVSSKFPLLSFVSMIAPSPDWFVGVRGAKVYENNTFVDKLELNMGVYDSGTDDGLTYKSPNKPSIPKVKVHKFTSAPLFQNGTTAPVAVLVIEKM